MTADPRATDDPLFTTRWVHVFEEDTGDGAVYRPEDAKIPLSRRPREQLVLGADGRATLFSGGPDDRLIGRPVRWRDQRDEPSGSPGAASDAEVMIVDRSSERLVVRTPDPKTG